MNVFNTSDIGVVPIPKLNVLQECHFVVHAQRMKNGARKILSKDAPVPFHISATDT